MKRKRSSKSKTTTHSLITELFPPYNLVFEIVLSIVSYVKPETCIKRWVILKGISKSWKEFIISYIKKPSYMAFRLIQNIDYCPDWYIRNNPYSDKHSNKQTHFNIMKHAIQYSIDHNNITITNKKSIYYIFWTLAPHEKRKDGRFKV